MAGFQRLISVIDSQRVSQEQVRSTSRVAAFSAPVHLAAESVSKAKTDPR
jgi:hypothetical protein